MWEWGKRRNSRHMHRPWRLGLVGRPERAALSCKVFAKGEGSCSCLSRLPFVGDLSAVSLIRRFAGQRPRRARPKPSPGCASSFKQACVPCGESKLCCQFSDFRKEKYRGRRMLGGAFAEVGPASQASQDDVARRKAGEAAEQRQQEAAVRAPQVTQPAEPSDGDGAAAVAAAATRNAQEAVDNTAWPSSMPVAHQSPSESGDGCWVAIRRVPGSSSKDAIVLDESDDEEGHVGGGKGGGAAGGGAQAASRQLPPRGGRPGGSQTASAAPGRSQRPRHPQPAALALTPVSVGDGMAVRGQLVQQPTGAAGAARIDLTEGQ